MAAAAGKKSHKANVPRQLSPEIESESESEDINEILARIESHQAKLAAKKAAKPLTKRAALEAQRALLDKQIDEMKNADLARGAATAKSRQVGCPHGGLWLRKRGLQGACARHKPPRGPGNVG